jgi:hypothetical protein
MVAIAETIIKRRSGRFDPATFRDRYQEALRELIEAKDERPPDQAKTDRSAAGARSHGGAQAQPGAGDRRSKAEAESRRRSPASQPVAAGVRKEKRDGGACASDGPPEPAKSSRDGIRCQSSRSALPFRNGGAELPQFALASKTREGRIPPAYCVITRPLEDQSAMRPTARRFLLPGTGN